jgi:exodeoxyribonuclease VII large subunit
VTIYPVPVQGTSAAAAIARAIAVADQRQDCDVLILARGGGSLEDLRAFNEEVVARSIYACELPIVTGIGHEIDFTIADLVADRRAPTPSASAELVTPDRQQVEVHLAALRRRLFDRLNGHLERAKHSLKWLQKRLVHPGRRLQDLSQRLDELALRLGLAARILWERKHSKVETLTARLHRIYPLHDIRRDLTYASHLGGRLEQAVRRILTGCTAHLTQLSRALQTVSPLATLDRGYAIVTTWPEGRLVREAVQVRPGDRLLARLARGRIQCQVEEIINDAAENQI